MVVENTFLKLKDIERYTKVDNQNTTPQATKQPTTNETKESEQSIEEDVEGVEKGDTDNEELNAKIQRAIENEAFEKSMKVFSYKTLEEKTSTR